MVDAIRRQASREIHLLLLLRNLLLLRDPPTYLIFVTNAANAVRVKYLAECKKIPENEKITALGSVYIITVIT